jgi:hypothetical protein
MKIKFYVAAALAVAFMGCKNEAADYTKTTNDTTKAAAKTTDGAVADTASTAPEATDAGTPAEGKVLLRLNYPKGFEQTLVYNLDTKGDAMNGIISLTLKYGVAGVTTGATPTYTLAGKITGTRMNFTAMGNKMEYDSSKKISANADKQTMAMDKQYRTILKEALTFGVDSRGKLVAPMAFSGEAKEVKSPFDINSYYLYYPEKAVGVGDSWSAKVESAQAGGILDNTYTVKEISDTTVIIAVKSIWPAPAMQGAKPSVFTGTYIIDRATGMVTKGSVSGYMEAMGATITMSFIGKQVK